MSSPVSTSGFPPPANIPGRVNDRVDSGDGPPHALMGREARRLKAYNIPAHDPIRHGRTRAEQRRMQAGETWAVLSESAGPELEFKASGILEDEDTFLVTVESSFKPFH